MSAIHIHAPKPTRKKLITGQCPTCKRKSWFVAVFTPWYGWDQTCLRCGEEWQDGQMCPRPFMPAWRKKNIEAAKKSWRRTFHDLPDGLRT